MQANAVEKAAAGSQAPEGVDGDLHGLVALVVRLGAAPPRVAAHRQLHVDLEGGQPRECSEELGSGLCWCVERPADSVACHGSWPVLVTRRRIGIAGGAQARA